MKEKIETYWLSALILVIIILCVLIQTYSKDMSCDKCIIEFKSKIAFNKEYYTFSIGVDELYDNFYNNKKCKVFWDYVAGYRLQ